MSIRSDTCAARGNLVVRDLANGSERVLRSEDATVELVGPISFAPDSRHVLGHVTRGSDPWPQAWEFDTATQGDVITGRIIPGTPGGPVTAPHSAQRYLGDTGLLAAAVFDDVPNVYSIDPADGSTRGIIYGQNGSPGETGWTLAGTDRTGRHLLLLVQTTTTYLARVVTGDGARRVRLGEDGIVAAAWVR